MLNHFKSFLIVFGLITVAVTTIIFSTGHAEDNLGKPKSSLSPECIKIMSGMSDSLGKNNFEETERLGNVFSRSCGKGTPDFASFGYENCALAAVMAGKYKDAVDYCKRCLNVSPDNAACYMHRGAALAYLGDKSGSLPSLPSSGLVTSINLSSCLISI